MHTYAIGDIHGHFNSLNTLLNSLKINHDDEFVFLGDYIDKGPQTKEVIELLISFSSKYKTTFVKGNHEIIMLDALKGEKEFTRWFNAGGELTLNSYNANSENWVDKINADHWNFFNNMVDYYEKEDFIFVHAGLEQGIPVKQQSKDFLFNKKFEIPEMYSEDKTVVCGHTLRRDGNIADFKHTICIDTNSNGNWLTCLNIDDKSFIQSNNEGLIRKGKLFL